MNVYTDKFIAFVDILGFKTLVSESEAGTGIPPHQLINLLERLGKKEDEEAYREYGPTVCPNSSFLQKDLDFRVSQVSDCVVVSAEISPAGVINLISHCWGAVLNLLTEGIMCRGYINRGSIYYHGDQFPLGTGYQEAYEKEGQVSVFKREADERGTPFVEVDRRVIDYVDSSTDECVRMMFSRMVRRFDDTAALYPFDRLNHSFVFAGMGVEFDPDRERQANQRVRDDLTHIRRSVLSFVDPANESAVRKSEHYVMALDEALGKCDAMDAAIDRLQERFPKDTF